MTEYIDKIFPTAYLELRLSKEELIELTFAELQDLLILNDYNKTIEREHNRNLYINALTVLEINKNGKHKKFKDSPMYQEQLEMYDYIFNEKDIVAEKEHVKKEKEALLAGLGMSIPSN